jgi:hypothetical protein
MQTIQTILVILLVLVAIILALKIREVIKLKKLVKQKDKEYSLLNSEYHDTKDTLVTIRRNHVSQYETLQDRYEQEKVDLLKANINKTIYLKYLLIVINKVFNNLGKHIMYTDETGVPKNIWLVYSKEAKAYKVQAAFGKEDISNILSFHNEKEDIKALIEKGIIGEYETEQFEKTLDVTEFDVLRESILNK